MRRNPPTPALPAVSALAALLLGALPGPTLAAAGMWPLDLLPESALQAHGLKPEVKQLMASTLRLPNGTGSFVSARGLVLTNHHVVSDCIAALASPREPLLQRGFVAERPAQERRCPGMAVEQLLGMDTLDELPRDDAARRARLDTLIGRDCPPQQRCELVSLYGGARLQRYRYRVWHDVRLVMAPESQAANFGGDEDNFNYPRFAFDFALLRVYGHDGRPVRPAHWLRPAVAGPRLGDGLMVSGHPYRTDRLFTLAQLEAERDAVLPASLGQLHAQREALLAFAARGAEPARQAADPLATVENSLKALQGALRALQDPELMQAKRDTEQRVRAGIDDTAWTQLARVAQAGAELLPLQERQQLPAGGLLDDLLERLLLRGERERADAERLAAYRGEPAQQRLRDLHAGPLLAPELETELLLAQWRWVRQGSEPNSDWMAAWPAAPDAATLDGWLRLSRLQDPRLREDLLVGRIDLPELAAQEPVLQWALRLLPLRRALLLRLQVEHGDALREPMRAVARARWQVLGSDEAPDATFSLRLSFGRAAEVSTAGMRHPWQTTLGGLFARADGFSGQRPFDLAPRVAAARARLDPRAPLNFVADADIVGGNSGSPVLDAQGRWTGLAFDGNLESLAGQYHFDGRANRMVALHPRAIQLALTRIYPARHLARELGL